MLSAIRTNSQRQTLKPRLVAVAPSFFRISPGRFERSAPAPPDRVNQIRTRDSSNNNAMKAAPAMKTIVSHAGSFSGDVAGSGVADCKRNSADAMSGIDSTETNLYVAKCDQVSVVDGAGVTVGDTLAIDVGPVGRTGIGDHQRAKIVHLERRVNFRNARIVQMQMIIGSAPNIEAAAAGNKLQGYFARRVAGKNPGIYGDVKFVSVLRSLDRVL